MSNTRLRGPQTVVLQDNAAAGWVGVRAETTDADLVLSPNGTGALQAQAADAGTGGGNVRGSNAVDWQQVRTAATQVASGDFSTLGGGRRNVVSGAAATIGGGQDNTASGVLGSSAGGTFSISSATAATVGGGSSNTASTDYAMAPGGFRALADRYGMFSHASGQFAAQGDAQYSRMVLRIATTDATPTLMTADGGAGSATTRVTVPNNTGLRFAVMIMARDVASTDARWWEFRGGILKDTTALSTALIGSNAAETGFNSPNAQAWVATATADTTNGALAITVTGALGVTIRWVATVHLTRVSF